MTTSADFAARLYDRILDETNADPDVSERAVAIRVIGSAIDAEVARRRAAEGRLRELAALARSALAQVDQQLAADPYPSKYRAPFAALTRLRAVLDIPEGEE